ncbi:MAG TPA: hypothetical protein VL443_06370 [Cyclobacteriaceae bacterium]|jgi:hypothetical protein|nr:hypothetical protein [Cyclobacteriaceae bacterium]
MAFIAQPDSSLSAIRTKVRRLTRSPSEAQLTTSDLDTYINTFVVYDFPEHLRTFNLRTTFTFFTNPYQDEYPTDMASFGTNPLAQNNPLYNFQNNYISIHPPVYIAGYQALYTQSPEQFFNIYPKINFIQATASTGDGVTSTFSGVINTQQAIVPNSFQQRIALLQGQVLFSSADSNLEGLALADVPVIDPGTGNKSVIGNLYDPNSAAYQAALVNPPDIPLAGVNTINYATGAYTITFAAAPGANIPINSQTVPQVLALPQAVMYYANKFVIRPIPDQPYRINMEVYQVPTQLLASNSLPALNEYWQFIAYGASLKIFQDRMDMDSVQMILPEFRNQMNLCNRRTIVQYTNERTATIYTEQTAITTGGWTGWGNNT